MMDLSGKNAEHPVEAVLPGILAHALTTDNNPNGQFFSSIDHKLNIALFMDYNVG